MVVRSAGETFRCSACQEPCIGAQTIKGKVAAIEVAAREGGNVWLGRNTDNVVCSAVLGGPLLDKAREVGMGLHYDHHARCPDAARFRS